MSWFICPQSLVAVFKGIRALFIIVMDDGSLPFCDLSLTHALYLSLLLSDLPSVTCVARLTTSLEIVDITFPRGKRGGHEKKRSNLSQRWSFTQALNIPHYGHCLATTDCWPEQMRAFNKNWMYTNTRVWKDRETLRDIIQACKCNKVELNRSLQAWRTFQNTEAECNSSKLNFMQLIHSCTKKSNKSI